MTITPARYAKNCFLARIDPNDSKGGWKGRESWLLCNLGGRYSGRENGYILPNSKLDITKALLENGWNGIRLVGANQKPAFIAPSGQRYNLREAKKILLKKNKLIS